MLLFLKVGTGCATGQQNQRRRFPGVAMHGGLTFAYDMKHPYCDMFIFKNQVLIAPGFFNNHTGIIKGRLLVFSRRVFSNFLIPGAFDLLIFKFKNHILSNQYSQEISTGPDQSLLKQIYFAGRDPQKSFMTPTKGGTTGKKSENFSE